jgi:hypothetical protein
MPVITITKDESGNGTQTRSDLVRQPHGGALRPIRPGEVRNPSGKSGLFGQVQRMCRQASPDAVQRLIDLTLSNDERVALLAITKLLEWGWGSPPAYKPEQDGPRFDLDLTSLSNEELAVLKKVVVRPRVEPGR